MSRNSSVCHPERSRTIREVDRSAESKDPYTLLHHPNGEGVRRTNNLTLQELPPAARLRSRGPSTSPSHALRAWLGFAQDDNQTWAADPRETITDIKCQLSGP